MFDGAEAVWFLRLLIIDEDSDVVKTTEDLYLYIFTCICATCGCDGRGKSCFQVASRQRKQPETPETPETAWKAL